MIFRDGKPGLVRLVCVTKQPILPGFHPPSLPPPSAVYKRRSERLVARPCVTPSAAMPGSSEASCPPISCAPWTRHRATGISASSPCSGHGWPRSWRARTANCPSLYAKNLLFFFGHRLKSAYEKIPIACARRHGRAVSCGQPGGGLRPKTARLKTQERAN